MDLHQLLRNPIGRRASAPTAAPNSEATVMDLRSLPIEPCPEAVQWLAEHRLGRIPKIWRDRHLKEFIDERLTRMPFYALAALCVEVFGKERAPGKSTLHRYYRIKWRMRPDRLQPRTPQ